MEYPIHPDIAADDEGSASLCAFPIEPEDLFLNFNAYRAESKTSSILSSDWAYVEIVGPTGQRGHAILVPSDVSPAPPTAAIVPLAKAISISPEFWDADSASISPQAVHVLLEDETWSETPGAESIGHLFSPEWLHQARVMGIVRTQLATNFAGDNYRKLAFQLACKAPSITYDKYRFLEYYRSIERLYMKIVLDDLCKDFYGSPRKALDDASNAISRESEALYRTIKNSGALDIAGEIAEIVDNSKSNQFAISIAKKLKDKSKEKAAEGLGNFSGKDFFDKNKKGTEYLYSIRCAIVHAGARDIIIEAFPDYSDLLRDIEYLFSKIALKCVGISVYTE